MRILSIVLATSGISLALWLGICELIAATPGATIPVRRPPIVTAPTPGGGPIASGLQLRLRVENPEPGTDEHVLHLAVANVSDQVIVLRYDAVPTRQSPVSFEEVLREHIGFKFYPEVHAGGLQSVSSPGERVPVPTWALAPGAELEQSWDTDSRVLKSGRSSASGYSVFKLQCDGQYGLRAIVDLDTVGGGKVRLWSNEVAYVVGASRERPKPHVGRVSRNDNAEVPIALNLGARDGVAVGDVYEYWPSLQYGWDLTVTDVDDAFSCVRLEFKKRGPADAPEPQLPQSFPVRLVRVHDASSTDVRPN